ncbi:osteoclast-associated immunoglobulin-like receptor isoform X9 [Gallus gallus]|uniref:osteoclast-associated immunoglobulin-like receptor isoform X9 n=1 Tax=Gallus gallus TaxID=9031 RepID=UPI001F031A6D|nr:osteoclast-associated immunoglobulin-like receptor isoform X9 [Gallus gallus]
MPAASGYGEMTTVSRCPQAAPASWHQWRWPSSSVIDSGDVVPRGLVALSGTRTVSLAGWRLVTVSRAQQLPRPSLSLHPSQGLSLGDTVILRCHLPQLASRIQLCQDQCLTSCMDKYEMQDVADFYICTKREHAGTYRCQYQVLKPLKTSEKSDPVELVVTDLSFPPPGISLSPGGHVGTGTNITIRCWNKDYGATFLLHKDGCSAALQRQHPDNGGMATFALFQVLPWSPTGTWWWQWQGAVLSPLCSFPSSSSSSSSLPADARG